MITPTTAATAHAQIFALVSQVESSIFPWSSERSFIEVTGAALQEVANCSDRVEGKWKARRMHLMRTSGAQVWEGKGRESWRHEVARSLVTVAQFRKPVSLVPEILGCGTWQLLYLREDVIVGDAYCAPHLRRS